VDLVTKKSVGDSLRGCHRGSCGGTHQALLPAATAIAARVPHHY
jgi:hypothetical protein